MPTCSLIRYARGFLSMHHESSALDILCTTLIVFEIDIMADDIGIISSAVYSKSPQRKMQCSSAIQIAPRLSLRLIVATRLSTSSSSVLLKPKESFDSVSPLPTKLQQSLKCLRPPRLFPTVLHPANTSTHTSQICAIRSLPPVLVFQRLWISRPLLKLLPPPP